MSRIAFIIPYFGHFNNYFGLFLKSCESNKNICDWLIFTDDTTKYDYPENVKVNYFSWKDMKDLIEHKLGYGIERPYKLCDYKPAYGLLFSEYLTGYEFWGYCDTDLIWGNIQKFITSELLNNYDKIFDLGHCTLYRNNDIINRLFLNPLNGRERYKEVFENKNNVSFDEEYKDSINNICLQEKIHMFTDSFAANTYMKTSNFRLTYLDSNRHTYSTEKKSKSFFVWKAGELLRYICKNGKWVQEEYLYIHFQSRKMKNCIDNPQPLFVYKIIPNTFEKLEVDRITEKNINSIKRKHFNLHYFRLRLKNISIKLGRVLKKND